MTHKESTDAHVLLFVSVDQTSLCQVKEIKTAEQVKRKETAENHERSTKGKRRKKKGGEEEEESDLYK